MLSSLVLGVGLTITGVALRVNGKESWFQTKASQLVHSLLPHPYLPVSTPLLSTPLLSHPLVSIIVLMTSAICCQWPIKVSLRNHYYSLILPLAHTPSLSPPPVTAHTLAAGVPCILLITGDALDITHTHNNTPGDNT